MWNRPTGSALELPSAVEFASGWHGLDQSTQLLRWISVAVLIGSVAYGVSERRSQDTRRRYWPQVVGRVVSERYLGYGSGDSTHDSVVAFRTLDGTEILGSPRRSVYLGLPVAGREVPVWYDPRDPNLFEARTHALDRAGSLPLLVALVPGVLFLVSFLL